MRMHRGSSVPDSLGERGRAVGLIIRADTAEGMSIWYCGREAFDDDDLTTSVHKRF